MLLLWLYDAGIALYVMALHMAAGFHPKARKWVRGRENWEIRLQNQIAEKFRPGKARLWMHCASLGEFEQGRPVLEAWRSEHPESHILLTFFSPSGYEIRKDYPGADIVAYLPADTPRAARRFVELAQPDLVIFVKYEFWLRTLLALFRLNISVLLISAVFRPGQIFFKWYGGLWKKVLSGFQHIFVQDAASLELLQRHGIQTCSIAGDTRVDRVMSIAAEGREIEAVRSFVAEHRVFIAGSTWPPDEELLAILLRENLLPGWKFIIAPHQISESNLQRIESLLPAETVRFSTINPEHPAQAAVLLIDNIGMLNALYRYGDLAYIGGGFGAGIHNTLEPMAFGLPVIFGPKYGKFREAVEMVQHGGAVSVQDTERFRRAVAHFAVEEHRLQAREAALQYLREQAGATGKILGWVK
jgi:3-deoxy-D-manno-octulosonic-acid transferase